METLKPGTPLSVREPVVMVDPRLPVGTYRVVLVVEGSRGKSEPASLVIKVFKE